MSDLEPSTPAMESAGLNKLADRLGWIAAQLSDIGWGDDSASVAQASDLIRRQASSVPPVTHNPPNPAPLLWLLWKHLGSQSPVGQPIREYLGIGQFDRMTEEQVEAAKQYVECETCQGLGTIDETLGGWSTDNPAATCPDCDGVGEARRFHRPAGLQVVQDQRDIAINMLAKWCVAVKTKGSGWDAWDAHYKNVLFGPGPLRELLDEAIGKLATEGG